MEVTGLILTPSIINRKGAPQNNRAARVSCRPLSCTGRTPIPYCRAASPAWAGLLYVADAVVIDARYDREVELFGVSVSE